MYLRPWPTAHVVFSMNYYFQARPGGRVAVHKQTLYKDREIVHESILVSMGPQPAQGKEVYE